MASEDGAMEDGAGSGDVPQDAPTAELQGAPGGAGEGLAAQLEAESAKYEDCQEKLKHLLADFANLSKKTQSDIESGVNARVDGFVLDFLGIYDDFGRARQAFAEGNVDTGGLDAILKNMDSLLAKYDIAEIDAAGTFDPRYHEPISSVVDPGSEEGTITKEIRKGYISQTRVIRPALVEISKKE